jgi:hypothetical protein
MKYLKGSIDIKTKSTVPMAGIIMPLNNSNNDILVEKK